MPDSDDDRDANSDYEDENEGPLVDISDMLAIDEIDVGMVYGLESFKSDWEQAGVETLEGPSVAMLDVTKNNESSSSKVKSVSFGVNKMDLPQDIVHGEPDGNMAIDSEGEDFNRYIIVPKYDEFNKDTDMVNTITSTLKRAIIEVAIKEGIEVRFSKNNSTQIRTLKPHSCNRTFKVSLVSRKWLIENYYYRIRNNPNYLVNSLKQDIRSEHVLDVSRSMFYRVRKNAATEILGSEKE
ncbi:hypothetical protein M9H77_25960 [Catharanthus roseus]|uniref:Uncharacterized protein n=1 Tax=Catharanthus roseus TaxID=4058 RepID=A0ACC0AB12_CATRO|nr:hypothetical protein M9H77_25960 [Catharanthus roseus]